jgi:hypothetical protein
LAFPGADDLGNMFQFKRDLEDYFCGVRNPDFARSLNPSLQGFAVLSKSGHEDLKRFRGGRRRLVQRLVDVLYDVVPNPTALLVDKILRRL